MHVGWYVVLFLSFSSYRRLLYKNEQLVPLSLTWTAHVMIFAFVCIAGFSQGVRRSVGGLATILGPLWAGGLTENMYIMMGVMMALLALLTVCKSK